MRELTISGITLAVLAALLAVLRLLLPRDPAALVGALLFPLSYVSWCIILVISAFPGRVDQSLMPKYREYMEPRLRRALWPCATSTGLWIGLTARSPLAITAVVVVAVITLGVLVAQARPHLTGTRPTNWYGVSIMSLVVMASALGGVVLRAALGIT
jgi:hypothetical protein